MVTIRMADLVPASFRSTRLLVVLIGCASVGIGVFSSWPYIMDDALITLRYSYNFANLGIPVWNPADVANPSMGFTSIIWMFLNTIPPLFIADKDLLLSISRVILFVPLFFIIWAFSNSIDKLPISTFYKVLIILLIFLQPCFGFHVNSEMETILYSCLVLFGIIAFVERPGSWWPYLFAYLSFLTRPEGGIFVVLLIIIDLLRGYVRRPLLGVLGFSIIISVTALILFKTYGSILPNPFFIKQGGNFINISSLRFTIFFILGIAFPVLIGCFFGAFLLKDRSAKISLVVGLSFIIYYLTVTPLMNNMYRYQWAAYTILCYGSIPAFGYLIKIGLKKTVYAIVVLLLLIDFGNLVAVAYFSLRVGTAMRNIINIGKVFAKYKDESKWLVYGDAGAVCYYSGWNTFETLGLTNREVALRRQSLDDILSFPQAAVVLMNMDLARMSGDNQKKGIAGIEKKGFSHIGDIPLVRYEDKKPFIVAVFARDRAWMEKVFHEINVWPDVKKSWFDRPYVWAQYLIKNKPLPSSTSAPLKRGELPETLIDGSGISPKRG